MRPWGGAYSFSVAATGANPLSYQWYRNGLPLSGAVNASYSVANATVRDAGRYFVEITDSAGTTVSDQVWMYMPGTLWGKGDSSNAKLGIGRPNLSLGMPVLDRVIKCANALGSAYAIRDDNTLWAAGDNQGGQLGNGTTVQSKKWIQVATDVIEVAAAPAFCVIIKSDGSMWATGDNSNGNFGDGTTISSLNFVKVINSGVTAVAVSSILLSNASATSVEGDDTGKGFSTSKIAFLKNDKTLWVAGQCILGIKGDGTHENIAFNSATRDRQLTKTPVRVPVSGNVIDFALCYDQLLAVTEDNVLWYTGEALGPKNEAAGQGGIAYTRGTLVQVMTGVKKVYSSDPNPFAMALKTNNELWGWGLNNRGQLGDGTISRRGSPVFIAANVKDVQVSMGGYNAVYSTFLKNDGTRWAAGNNTYGALGIDLADSITHIQTTSNVKSLGSKTGADYSSWIDNNNVLWLAGRNNAGNFGNDVAENQELPCLIAHNVRQVASDSTHTIYLDTNGDVWGFGSNASGQLGLPSSGGLMYGVPVKIFSGAKAIFGSNYDNVGGIGANSSTFIIKSDNSFWECGIPYGTTAQTTLNGNFSITQTDTNVYHFVTSRATRFKINNLGDLYGKGRTDLMGVNDSTGIYSVYTKLDSGVASIATAGFACIRLYRDGSIKTSCGQLNKGTLGNGTVTNGRITDIPPSNYGLVSIAGPSSGVAIAASFLSTYFIGSNAVLYSTGINLYGGLGNGNTTDQSSFSASIVTDAVTFSASFWAMCFIKSDASLWQMGDPMYGNTYYRPDLFAITTPLKIADRVVYAECAYQKIMFIQQ